MHLLYCDESNIDERPRDFLVYAGLMISADAAPELSAAIEKIRNNAGIPRDFRLKFNPRPDNLDHAQFREVKQQIIEAAVAYDVGLLSYMILHDICVSMDEARRNGINTVCYHFDRCLAELKSKGLVLIDRFNDEGNEINAHLQEKFSVGVTGMPYSKEIRLSNILGLHYSAIGQSHFTSLIDVVVGSMRWAMNQHTRGAKQNWESARTLLALLSPLFVRTNGKEEVSEFGLLFSPKVVRSPHYRAIYQGLKDFFAEAGIIVAQDITGERNH
ncbi:MAG: hypothetical protein AMXMBFR74_29290 [Parvibaculum sp.]|uniref:hypothetical protein n=1 Tax=Parvibaculum sp. TaxID=2024848 RepID=UPI0035B856AC